MPQFEEDLGLEGIVGLDSAVNDDITNFTNPKKKKVVKDTIADKKVTQSALSEHQNADKLKG